MEVIITGRHIEGVSEYKDYIAKKTQKLEQYLKKISKVHVVLTQEKTGVEAEFILTAKHFTTSVKSRAGDARQAIDGAFDILKQKVLKQHDKLKYKYRNILYTLFPFRKKASAEDFPVTVKKLDTKPIDLEEAREELRAFKRDFLIFRNVSTNQINVLYKKKDGTLELLEP
jgi:putative sigma-54 modulation protein